MDKRAILPIGEHPVDPLKNSIDPIGYALKRLQTHLIWIDEHRAAFEKLRDSDPNNAKNELNCLKDSNEQAILHLQRLTELLMLGHVIDPQKDLPKDLCSEIWCRTVEIVQRARAIAGKDLSVIPSGANA